MVTALAVSPVWARTSDSKMGLLIARDREEVMTGAATEQSAVVIPGPWCVGSRPEASRSAGSHGGAASPSQHQCTCYPAPTHLPAIDRHVSMRTVDRHPQLLLRLAHSGLTDLQMCDGCAPPKQVTAKNMIMTLNNMHSLLAWKLPCSRLRMLPRLGFILSRYA